MNDPNRLTWPPSRSDIAALLCFAVAAGLILANRWPVIVAIAILAGVFAAVSPRMKGPFGLHTAGGNTVGGSFVSPFGRATKPRKTRARSGQRSGRPQSPRA
jgi:hypothetical protein